MNQFCHISDINIVIPIYIGNDIINLLVPQNTANECRHIAHIHYAIKVNIIGYTQIEYFPIQPIITYPEPKNLA